MKPIWFPLFAVVILCTAAYWTWRNWGFWNNKEDYHQNWEKWPAWFFTIAGVTIGLAIASLASEIISDFIASKSDQQWRECWRAKMVSLRSSDGVSGSIHGGVFLLQGSIGSEQFYHYYTPNPDGTFVPRKWKADYLVRIFEEDRKDGESVQACLHFTHEWVYWFAKPSNDRAMDFHIPRGTLHQEFSLQ